MICDRESRVWAFHGRVSTGKAFTLCKPQCPDGFGGGTLVSTLIYYIKLQNAHRGLAPGLEQSDFTMTVSSC